MNPTYGFGNIIIIRIIVKKVKLHWKKRIRRLRRLPRTLFSEDIVDNTILSSSFYGSQDFFLFNTILPSLDFLQYVAKTKIRVETQQH